MKIALGCDHGGLNLKELIREHLEKKGIEVKDFGTYTTASCDYPDISEKVGVEVRDGHFDFGILICGTGIGIGIAANKIPGVRAALCHDTFSAHATRQHNNANILTMGERVVGPSLALDIVDTFLGASFEGGRHQTRIDKITQLEEKYQR
ncbi:ribose 5-phosphate isomerase B [Proteiniclasticum sp. BAD-10]|uniref:Ribose 5-phosphate isomerase B n=1 Tax=Proteiniclasticum sediminis TaxID=2804028 RepID=A0A941CRA3_9CLOT|nr:ribose 5-phosphate isomerase B [Proteiniclasticum sediminis]MBR0576684.1 ribose 5-phosphate isomerase B [Proteiniclasticum sediminis]